MGELAEQVCRAAEEPGALERLLEQYLPFIKKQAARWRGALDHDDAVSLAMLAFAGAVRQYRTERGAFLPFAAACIKNRLTDEARRELRRTDKVLPFPEGGAEPSEPFAYDRELERQALAEELERYGAALETYGLDFRMLAQCCPKQNRARALCRDLARLVTGDGLLRSDFLRTGRLPQAELAHRSGVSVKTVEKHRKYIVALTVLFAGDFPDIRAFLPKGVEL